MTDRRFANDVNRIERMEISAAATLSLSYMSIILVVISLLSILVTRNISNEACSRMIQYVAHSLGCYDNESLPSIGLVAEIPGTAISTP